MSLETRTITLAALLSGGLLLGTGSVSLAAKGGDASPQPNWRGTPLYETVELTSGFDDDPYTVDLDAGGDGSVDDSLAPGCAGNINLEKPDVDLNYESGDYPLFITVNSSADTTLVVYGPEGRWYCNDDFGSSDPMVVFHNPQSGNYNIWVGVYEGSTTPDATLTFTEINPM